MFDQLDILLFLLVRICYIKNYQREFQKEFYWLLLERSGYHKISTGTSITRKFHTSFAFIAFLREGGGQGTIHIGGITST